jgi:hypothetical protein
VIDPERWTAAPTVGLLPRGFLFSSARSRDAINTSEGNSLKPDARPDGKRNRREASAYAKASADRCGDFAQAENAPRSLLFLIGEKARRSFAFSACPCARRLSVGFHHWRNPAPATHERKPTMPRRKNPHNEPFRPTQVVSPVPSERRYGRPKIDKKNFDVYVSDIETGEEHFAITVFAPDTRQAIQIGRKLLKSSPLVRKITYAAYSAVEVVE